MLLGNVGVAAGHRALHLDRTLDGIDDAGEFGQHPVSRGLDDAAVVGRDHWLHYLAEVGFEGAERARFIEPHEARVAHHVGGKDRRQLARLARLAHLNLQGQHPSGV